MHDDIRINLGSGHWKLDGWVNVDVDPECAPDILADLGASLPFRDEVAAYLHTEDFIDQLPLDGGEAFLLECRRILRPGGVLRVLTPDLERLAHLYVDDPITLCRLWEEHVGLPLRVGTAGEVFNLGMRFAGHTFLYDPKTFEELARRCGFEPRRVAYNESERSELRGLDLRPPDRALSMYWDCYRL